MNQRSAQSSLISYNKPLLFNTMSGIPEIESEYSSEFRQIKVVGVAGGVVPGGLEATVYSERRDIERALKTAVPSMNLAKIKRIVECELIIDPMEMKTVYAWLGKKIEDYEVLFGPIPSPQEVETRQRQRQRRDGRETGE